MCIGKSKSINSLEFTTSESKNNPSEKYTNNDSTVNTIFIGVIVVMALIVLGSLGMFVIAGIHESKYFKSHEERLELENSLYLEVIPADSILRQITAVKGKPNSNGKNTKADVQTTQNDASKYLVPLSEVLKVREAQKQLLIRQNQLVDDIRQETNNIINKMNGWLGFWMGVMAILGVFVPIALQFKLYRESRDQDAKLRQECQKELDHIREETKHCVNRSETAQRNARADIKAELLKIEAEVDKQFHEIQTALHQDIDNIRFTTIIRSFHSIMDSPEIRTNELRNQLLEKNWNEIVTNFRRFITVYYTDQTESIGYSYSMSVILLQVASVLTSMRILVPRRKRQLELLAMESYSLIKMLNTIPSNKDAIISSLNNYQESLSNLNPMLF